MRKMVIAAALAAASLTTLAACKQDAGTEAAAAATDISGTWKADLASVQIETKPDELLLQDGTFSCSTCTPAYTVAADGAFHPVDRPYADSMAVKIDDDHHVTVTAKKGDRVTSTTRYAVSEDGKTLKIEFNDSSVPDAPPVTGSLTENRAADGPAGSHALSGSWQIAQYDNVSDEGLTFTYALDGDKVHLSTPGGVSYDAVLGGPDVPVSGDTAGTTVSIAKNDDGAYVETNKRDGMVISVLTMTVGDDGKMHVVQEDKRNGSKMTYDATKS